MRLDPAVLEDSKPTWRELIDNSLRVFWVLPDWLLVSERRWGRRRGSPWCLRSCWSLWRWGGPRCWEERRLRLPCKDPPSLLPPCRKVPGAWGPQQTAGGTGWGPSAPGRRGPVSRNPGTGSGPSWASADLETSPWVRLWWAVACPTCRHASACAWQGRSPASGHC